MGDYYKRIVDTIAERKQSAYAEFQTWSLLERTFQELKKKADDQDTPKRRWERFCAWAKGAGRAYAGYLDSVKVEKISVRQVELALGECASMVLDAHKAQLRKDWHEQDGGNQLFKLVKNRAAIDELAEALEKKYSQAANE